MSRLADNSRRSFLASAGALCCAALARANDGREQKQEPEKLLDCHLHINHKRYETSEKVNPISLLNASRAHCGTTLLPKALILLLRMGIP